MLRRIIERLHRSAGLLAGTALLTGCQAGYIMQQGVGQLGMLSRRESIAQVLQESTLPSKTRDRLTLSWYARRYAQQDIGLTPSQSYRDVIRLDRDAASYVVQAAPKDSLDPYRWCFPVAGCLPYIGYFNRDDARREARRLRDLGYDVYVRGVEAYSLGGWLPDPLYSSMLDGSRGRIANTVIHELTHGTVFVAGQARFNEGLATFVGDRGSLAFLASRYGRGSRTLREALDEQHDSTVFTDFLRRFSAELRAVYTARIPREEKLRRREVLFAAMPARIDRLPFRLEGYRRLRNRRINNAFLATIGTYHGLEERFDAVYQRLGGDMRRFVAFMRTEVGRAPDPEAYMTRWLDRHPPPAVQTARRD